MAEVPHISRKRPISLSTSSVEDTIAMPTPASTSKTATSDRNKNQGHSLKRRDSGLSNSSHNSLLDSHAITHNTNNNNRKGSSAGNTSIPHNSSSTSSSTSSSHTKKSSSQSFSSNRLKTKVACITKMSSGKPTKSKIKTNKKLSVTSDSKRRDKSTERGTSVLKANKDVVTEEEHEKMAEDAEEASKPPLVKQSSLDKLFAKVNMLKSLHTNILEKTTHKGDDNLEQGEDKDKREDEVKSPKPSVKQEEPKWRSTKIVFKITDDEEDLKDLMDKNDGKNLEGKDEETEVEQGNDDQTKQSQDETDPNTETMFVENIENKDAKENIKEGAVDLEKLCEMFSGNKGKKSFKDIVRDEVQRETTQLEKMMATSQTVAVGRRVFEKDEMEDSEESEESEPDEDNIMDRVKKAKPKYMQMFEKPKEEVEENESKEEIDTNPVSYGLWDSVSNVKILTTLKRAKPDWQPPDWDNIMTKMKEEGRDVASIDADLKDISQARESCSKKKTGKYLMPDDLAWCRKYAKFSERQLLKWFKKYRAACNHGEMDVDNFTQLFKAAYPWADSEKISSIIGDLFLADGEGEIDFKDFIVMLDVLTCKTSTEKFRWAFGLYDRERRGGVNFYTLKKMMSILDEVEETGFMNTPVQEEVDDIMYKRATKLDPLRLAEDRAKDIWNALDLPIEADLTVNDIDRIPTKLIYSRD